MVLFLILCICLKLAPTVAIGSTAQSNSDLTSMTIDSFGGTSRNESPQKSLVRRDHTRKHEQKAKTAEEEAAQRLKEAMKNIPVQSAATSDLNLELAIVSDDGTLAAEAALKKALEQSPTKDDDTSGQLLTRALEMVPTQSQEMFDYAALVEGGSATFENDSQSDVGRADIDSNTVLSAGSLVAENGSIGVVDQANRTAWHLRAGQIVALKGGRGHRWCADDHHTVRCNRGGIGPWEKFTVVDGGGGRIALRSGRSGRYCADEYHRWICNRGGLGPWERFWQHNAGGNVVGLRGGKHGRWCADEGHRITCNRGGLGPWERFQVHLLNPPVHCAWHNWGGWGGCSKPCGGGSQGRKRSIARHPRNGGNRCSGSSSENRACNKHPCAVACKWNSWGSWGACSKTCGGGGRQRKRSIAVQAAHGGKACVGDKIHQELCNAKPCPVDCKFDNWKSWGACSKTCGGGERSRTRVKASEAKHGGKACQGDLSEKEACGKDPCPVDCKWSKWEEWAECSVTCGGGKTSRTRVVEVEAQHGGKTCEGEKKEEDVCNEDECPTTTTTTTTTTAKSGSQRSTMTLTVYVVGTLAALRFL